MTKKYTIGRNPDNQIVVNNPAVSGYHADIYVIDDSGYPQYTFVDHSTNGTIINGQLLHQATCYVAYNDMIVFPGNVMFNWDYLATSNYITPHSESVLNTPYSAPNDMNCSHDFQARNVYGSNPVRQAVQNVPEQSGITFLNVVPYFFKHYVDFHGRAKRKEFWYVVLWRFIIEAVFGILLLTSAAGSVIDLLTGESGFSSFPVFGLILLAIYSIFCLGIMIPSLALNFRRIHDMGKKSGYFFLIFVPFVGFVFPLIWAFSESQPSDNQWGPYVKN